MLDNSEREGLQGAIPPLPEGKGFSPPAPPSFVKKRRHEQTIDLSQMTVPQQVRYAILAALAVLPNEEWAPQYRLWAEKWLSGEDRTVKAATWAVEWAVQGRGKWAAAAMAAHAAAVTAMEGSVEWATVTVEWARKADPSLNLAALARRAVDEEEKAFGRSSGAEREVKSDRREAR